MSLLTSSFEAQQGGGSSGEAWGWTSNTQKRLEIRTSSPQSFTWFSWTLGGTFNETIQERFKDYYDEDSIDTLSRNFRESKGLFANLNIPIPFTNNKLKATIGYRQSWDESGNDTIEAAGPNPGNLVTTAQKHSDPDFKYGFTYDMADNLMFYGNYSSSYRVSTSMQMQTADPETLDSYTGGAKSRWFGNKLQVNVSAFFYDYKNKFVNQRKYQNDVVEADYDYDFNNDGDTEDTVNVSDNQSQGYGDFESIGLDLQINWIITSKDRLNLSISHLDAVWTDLNFDYQYDILFPPESYDGITNTYSPEWSVSGGYTRTISLWEHGTLTPRIEMQYKSNYRLLWNPNMDPDNYSYQEPYFSFNGNATFNHSSGKWNINVSVKNITNYAAKTSYQGNAGNYKLRVTEPRNYSAVFSVKF